MVVRLFGCMIESLCFSATIEAGDWKFFRSGINRDPSYE
jgi:hypothetical protein